MTELTQYGFKFGPFEVTRLCSDDRFHTILVKTEHHEVQISASPKGRKLYVAPGSPRIKDGEQP